MPSTPCSQRNKRTVRYSPNWEGKSVDIYIYFTACIWSVVGACFVDISSKRDLCISFFVFPYKNARSAAILAALQNDSAQLSEKNERPAKAVPYGVQKQKTKTVPKAGFSHFCSFSFLFFVFASGHLTKTALVFVNWDLQKQKRKNEDFVVFVFCFCTTVWSEGARAKNKNGAKNAFLFFVFARHMERPKLNNAETVLGSVNNNIDKNNTLAQQNSATEGMSGAMVLDAHVTLAHLMKGAKSAQSAAYLKLRVSSDTLRSVGLPFAAKGKQNCRIVVSDKPVWHRGIAR